MKKRGGTVLNWGCSHRALLFYKSTKKFQLLGYVGPNFLLSGGFSYVVCGRFLSDYYCSINKTRCVVFFRSLLLLQANSFFIEILSGSRILLLPTSSAPQEPSPANHAQSGLTQYRLCGHSKPAARVSGCHLNCGLRLSLWSDVSHCGHAPATGAPEDPRWQSGVGSSPRHLQGVSRSD